MNKFLNFSRIIFVKTISSIFSLLLLLLFLNSNNVFAQLDRQAEIDSLTNLYSEAKKISDKKRLLTNLSNCYQNKGDWKKYEEVVEQMLLLQEEKIDSFYLAETYNKLGISNCILGENTKALDYFQKALEINIAQNMDLIAANSYENLGIVYKDMGNYTEAVKCQLKSLELRKEKNSTRIFNNYIKLSIVLDLLGDHERMDFYLDLAKREMNKRDSITPRNRALFYNQLGDIYSNRGLNDSSIICFKNVIRFSEQIGWKLGVAEGLGNIADIYYEKKNLDSSIFYHKKSLKLSQEISNTLSTTEQHLSLANLYNEAGNYDSVLYFSHKALQMAEGSDLLYEQSKILKFIADFHHSQENDEQAFTYLQKHYFIEDSISSANVKNNVAELETKYETKLKEQQIELLTAENKIKSQHNRISLLFVVALLVLLTLGVFIFLLRKKQATFKQADLQQQLLRSQMNPHFIFNVLGSIQNYVRKNEAKKAAQYLSQFASLSRSVLEFSSMESITLSEEIEMLKNYVALENMKSGNQFDFIFKMDDGIESDFIEIPPMMIQVFVENAIKHGLINLKYKGILKVEIYESKGFIKFLVEDNGVGIKTEMKDHSEHKSRAMDIFNQRKKLIEQKFKKELKFELINFRDLNPDQSGVKVNIHLPILNND